MSHQFFNGTVYHKRYHPKVHKFTYKFFMLDIDVQKIADLKNKYFSLQKFNVFSFFANDHFGNSRDFLNNKNDLAKQFAIDPNLKSRFITLPRIFGFVFNPLSVLIFYKDELPCCLLAEVHNYNGGRVVYKVELESENGKTFTGSSQKSMYVSPFLGREGEYKFSLNYDETKISMNVVLFEDGIKKLAATFQGSKMDYNEKNILNLLASHTFLTMWVVTRTLYQTGWLFFKGLKWNSPTDQDKIRRF